VPYRGTVLFIHGSGPGASGWSNFKGNYPALNAAGYRTLVPDMFGYGYSSKPTEGKFFMADLAVQFVGMLDGLGITEKVHLVGNSMGGAVCMRLALDHAARVGKLVLMAPGGLEERETYMNMLGIKTMLGNIGAGHTREGMRSTFGLQLFNPALITDEIIDERLQIAETQPPGLLARLLVKNQEAELANITQETLCFWGVNDNFCPVSGAAKVAERVPNSRTVIISQCGHWVMVEYPKLFNETTLRFLNGDLG
jgi:4,5:9,10-diseco-3-hydroxy-5,9,17-trioxoandrosta-1(10),2-diene-4-oate hydrolase